MTKDLGRWTPRELREWHRTWRRDADAEAAKPDRVPGEDDDLGDTEEDAAREAEAEAEAKAWSWTEEDGE